MRPMLRRPLPWIAALLAVVVAVVVLGLLRPPRVRVTQAVRRAIEQHVVASGRVWVPTRVQVAAQGPGLVIAVAVVEGQSVAAGDLLVQLDDAEARAAVAQARAARDQAAARVEQLRRVGAIVANESLRQAETNAARAEADWERAEKLATTGAIARVELDNARRALEVARAQRSSAAAQQLAAAPMGADSRLAFTSLMQAEALLTAANVRLAQTRITALQDAVVLTRSVQPGDVVQPSRTLLVLAGESASQLVFHPDERNLSLIALGQRARASADAYPQTVFDAEIGYIAPSIDASRGSVEVRLRVPEPPPVLKADMTVSIDLTVAAKASALTIPSSAVRGAASRDPWVLTVEGGRIVRRSITLGIEGEGSVEIASGLDEGAEVVIDGGARLAPGARVRAERE